MASAPHDLSENLTVDQLEMIRIDREIASIAKRHESLLSAIRGLTQKEKVLAQDLDLALQFNGKAGRPAETIATDLGAVRLGIGELERLRRESERQKADLENLGTNLSFALSVSQSRAGQKSSEPEIRTARTIPHMAMAAQLLK